MLGTNAHASGPGRHRPRPSDPTGERPAGIPAPVIVSWYWVRRATMAPLYRTGLVAAS